MKLKFPRKYPKIWKSLARDFVKKYDVNLPFDLEFKIQETKVIISDGTTFNYPIEHDHPFGWGSFVAYHDSKFVINIEKRLADKPEDNLLILLHELIHSFAFSEWGFINNKSKQMVWKRRAPFNKSTHEQWVVDNERKFTEDMGLEWMED